MRQSTWSSLCPGARCPQGNCCWGPYASTTIPLHFSIHIFLKCDKNELDAHLCDTIFMHYVSCDCICTRIFVTVIIIIKILFTTKKSCPSCIFSQSLYHVNVSLRYLKSLTHSLHLTGKKRLDCFKTWINFVA